MTNITFIHLCASHKYVLRRHTIAPNAKKKMCCVTRHIKNSHYRKGKKIHFAEPIEWESNENYSTEKRSICIYWWFWVWWQTLMADLKQLSVHSLHAVISSIHRINTISKLVNSFSLCHQVHIWSIFIWKKKQKQANIISALDNQSFYGFKPFPFRVCALFISSSSTSCLLK